MMSSRSPPNRSSPRQPSPPLFHLHSNHSRNFGSINIDDIFRNICSDSELLTLDAGDTAAVTLEDFLARAGVVNQGDLRIPAAAVPVLAAAVGGGGKRRAGVEVDEATQQKQRRMIKNRESAARSREKKQAYTVELESLVTQLQEDNARLLREEREYCIVITEYLRETYAHLDVFECKAEMHKERYKQIMRNKIPVVESRRPRRVIKRARSMEW